MLNLKNKTMTSIIAMILISSMAISMIPMSAAAYNNATQTAITAGMHWDLTANASSNRLLMFARYNDRVPTWTYGVISPNPVGVGQKFTMVIFNPQVPYQAQDTNDVRYKYHVIVTKPDGTTETLGPFTSDSTGTTFSSYTPTETGNYSVTLVFEELYWRWTAGALADYYGITFLSSNRTYTVTVQEDPVSSIATTDFGLPTEYWARPIEGQNTAWGQISSNWLNNANDRDLGSGQNRYQTQGIGPNSGHILWTKTTEAGGVVGGDDFSKPGQVFNAGHQYQTRFQTQIIMAGRLYYQEPIYFSGGGGAWVCVDLKTGQEIWRNQTMSATPSFGYYLDWNTMNDHGVVTPGWIFSNNYATAIHPLYGTTAALNITSVPSGTEVVGPKGDMLRYVLQNAGNSTVQDWRLYEWNFSRVLQSANSGTINASLANKILQQTTAPNTVPIPTWDFNVSVATSWTNTPTIRSVIYGDVLLGSNGTLPTSGTSSLTYHNAEESTLFAISLKEGEVGKLLWTKNYKMTFNDGSQNLFIRAGEGAFIMQHMPTLTFIAYSMYDGKELWRSEPQAELNPFGYYSWVSLMNVYATHIAYGKLFTTGYTGMVFCYDLKNGTLLWRQEAPTGGEIFKYYTLFIGTIADNKVYVGTHEHSADTPLLKGARTRVYDVNTGEEIWSMMGWAHPGTMAIADGTLIYWNNYDHQVYAVGKGPSSTTTSITNDVVPYGSSVLIKGTVTDVSAGTKQAEQSLRFPNGVPAVSDASQSAWMEYVYMQKPRPTNATGVDVTLSVIDSNGNYRDIGTTTANADGFFSFDWMPDIEGQYTVYASFVGSESYWPSHAVTAFVVDPAPPTPIPTAIALQSVADMYFVPAVAGIIVAIAIVGALLALLLLRKRP